MRFTIKDDKLQGSDVTHVRTNKKGGKINPRYLVIHYTAGMNYAADVATLSTGPAQASAHIVIGQDGQVTQVEDFRTKLWHAGVSRWDGLSNLNDHSIGIEVTCPGPVTAIPKDQIGRPGSYRTWNGVTINDGTKYSVIEAKHKSGLHPADKHWVLFTDKQIDALVEMGQLLMTTYGLKECVGHDDISPGRKKDPGPSCPQQVFDRINGRGDAPVPKDGTDGFWAYKIKGLPTNDTLNVRSDAGMWGSVIATLSEGDLVNRITTSGTWAFIIDRRGKTGWVAGQFLVPNE